MNSELTLKIIRKTEIDAVLKYVYFFDVDDEKFQKILEITILFINSKDSDVHDFGYRILLNLCIKTGNYLPLYDVSSHLGFIPVVKLLSRSDVLQDKDGFLHSLMNAYFENFRHNETYQTEKQKILFSDFSKNINKTVAVVAPTSYGKSQLIEETVTNNLGNIAIVVPSKALISQTRRRIMQHLGSDRSRRVVIHHDMIIDSLVPTIAVVTQERLLRIYQKNESLKFDIVFIDEAHNLLSDDKRSRLLASTIIISRIRNPNVAIKYLTPFLVSSESLDFTTGENNTKHIHIKEKLKSEFYFSIDIRSNGKLKIYDQYIDKLYETPDQKFSDELEFLNHNKRNKNIIYLNKPVDIERLAMRLIKTENQKSSPELQKIELEISEFIHPRYKILDCLRHGLAYHHGSVPDVVRAYIENYFRSSSSISWIITNSTLLEGVNIPAAALFVLDARKGRSKLSAAQFRNLAGRVNRFSEVFDLEYGNPSLLMPPIYLVGSIYSHAKLNPDKYISEVAKVDRKLTDVVNNPLLKGSGDDDDVVKKRQEDYTFIENIEPESNIRENKKLAQTLIGKLCFIHNINEFNIIDNELSLNEISTNLISSGTLISDPSDLMDKINLVFISRIPEDTNNREALSLTRFKNIEARSFYAMFFDWRINQVNYTRMIGNFIAYWKRIVETNPDPIIFVGKWGDLKRDGFIDNYVDLAGKNDYDLINLAIVRIKEEQDFIDNNLIKFLEIFNDLGLLHHDLYNKVKYGTTHSDQISLIKSGLSHIAANILISKYRSYVKIDNQDRVRISYSILDSFKERSERELISFEVEWSGLVDSI